MKDPNESEHIHRYPFDVKKADYDNSYKQTVCCPNCSTIEHIRISHGIKRAGLKYVCDNCKCEQTL